MIGQATPGAGQLRRRLREFWPNKNPLRRRWDRAEAVIIGGLLAAFVVGGTLAALIAGRCAYDGALHARRAELATSRQVPAVLLTTASFEVGFYASAKARWTAPDGARRTGEVFALAGSPAGATVKVWVDKAGRLADPPLRPSQVQGQGVLAAVLSVMTLGMVLWGTGLAVHCAADRRRMAAWDDEWQATGPNWSHQGGWS